MNPQEINNLVNTALAAQLTLVKDVVGEVQINETQARTIANSLTQRLQEQLIIGKQIELDKVANVEDFDNLPEYLATRNAVLEAELEEVRQAKTMKPDKGTTEGADTSEQND